MDTKMNLPIYDAVLVEGDDEIGVDKISLVKNPANKAAFMTFSEDKIEKVKVVLSEERKLLTAVVMQPDFPMYRDIQGHQFYVKYSAETIEKMAFKYMRELKLAEVNVEHSVDVKDVYIVESGIVDSTRGMSGPTGLELKEGSWWVTFKVDNPDVWGAAKDGTFTGVSLEGYFDLRQEFTSQEKVISEKQEPVSFSSLILRPDTERITLYNALVNKLSSKNTK